MKPEETARFDTKMSVLHKRLLEEAARLKGFKSLTEYVITTMVADATQVVKHHQEVLYSLEDKQKIMQVLNEPTELYASFLKASERRAKKLEDEISDPGLRQDTTPED